ncbi:MAG: hypothetical protein KIS87_10860 [Phycisphaeraceae bacterium]|nr:hypothetical protein [Phycisphaeraceae bacterium]
MFSIIKRRAAIVPMTFAVVLAFAFGAPTAAQHPRPTADGDTASVSSVLAHRAAGAADEAAALSLRAIVISGIARWHDGTPVENAVIVSSAGGNAVSAPDGSFTLAVDVPGEAGSVGVTAVATLGGVNYTAGRLVECRPGEVRIDLGGIRLDPAAECEPAWVPMFGQEPGMSSLVLALTVFDDGSGPALYAGGQFTTAGGVSANRIARWDGQSWSALGTGMNERVYALTVFDDGSGPALYAGGTFTTAGGVSAIRIARWDGQAWSALGSGMNDSVHALTVFDDGSGPALYAGGAFITSPAGDSYLAKWQGCAGTPCYADCNGDGNVNTLDFLCYLNRYVTGDPAADCNGDTLVNTLDFVCFLNAYTAGCP